MNDQFLPPGWFTQPATWPYWPKSLTGTPAQPTHDPSNQANPLWTQLPFGGTGGWIGPEHNNASDRMASAWLPPAPPNVPSGGILGSFLQRNDPDDQGNSSSADSSASRRGILALLEQNDQSGQGNPAGGILGPLDRANLAVPAQIEPFSRSNAHQASWSGPLQKLGSVLGDLFGISSAGAAEFRDPSRVSWQQLLEGAGFGGFGGAASRGPAQRPAINAPYSRPSVNTSKQRESVQGQPCESCGTTAPRMNANHIDPLVVEYYRTGKIDVPKARSIEAVNPQCPTCSARQGGYLSNFSKMMKRLYGFDRE